MRSRLLLATMVLTLPLNTFAGRSFFSDFRPTARSSVVTPAPTEARRPTAESALSPYDLVASKVRGIESKFGRGAPEGDLVNIARSNRLLVSDLVRAGVSLESITNERAFISTFNEVYKGISDDQAFTMGWVMLNDHANLQEMVRGAQNTFFDQTVMDQIKATQNAGNRAGNSGAGAGQAPSAPTGGFLPPASSAVSTGSFWDNCVKKPKPSTGSYSAGGSGRSPGENTGGGLDDKPVTPADTIAGKTFQEKCAGIDPSKKNKGQAVGKYDGYKPVGSAFFDGTGYVTTAAKGQSPGDYDTMPVVVSGSVLASASEVEPDFVKYEYEMNVTYYGPNEKHDIVKKFEVIKVTVFNEGKGKNKMPTTVSIKLSDGSIMEVSLMKLIESATGTLVSDNDTGSRNDTGAQSANATPTYDSEGSEADECQKLAQNANNNCVMDALKSDHAIGGDSKCDTLGVYGQPGVGGSINCGNKMAPEDALNKQMIFNKTGGGVTDPGYAPRQGTQNANDPQYKRGGSNY